MGLIVCRRVLSAKKMEGATNIIFAEADISNTGRNGKVTGMRCVALYERSIP